MGRKTAQSAVPSTPLSSFNDVVSHISLLAIGHHRCLVGDDNPYKEGRKGLKVGLRGSISAYVMVLYIVVTY